MIDRLEESGIVRSAGWIGRFFRIDPLVVVKSNYLDYAIRAAAYRYVSGKEEEASNRAKAEAAAKNKK